MFILSDFQKAVADRLSKLRSPVRIVVLAVVIIAAAALLLWIFNQTFYYLLAKNYADELSQAYNLNKGFSRALIWVSFAAVVLFAGYAFSFSKRKRIIGYLGVLSLIVHGVLIGIRDPNYDAKGNTQKCYVLTRDGIKISNHVGIDADTGRECRLLTPQMLEKYTSYKDGRRPQLVVDAQPNFFAPASGEPIVWYERTKAGRIELSI